MSEVLYPEETWNFLVHINNEDSHFIMNSINCEALQCGRVGKEYEKYCFEDVQLPSAKLEYRLLKKLPFLIFLIIIVPLLWL